MTNEVYSPGSNPEHIANLVEIGLESELEDDRLLALEAANYFDATHATSYGQEVLELFMEQRGLKFIDKDKKWYSHMEEGVPPGGETYSSETLRIGRIMQAIHRAVGSEIGLKMTVRRFVADDSEGVPIVADVSSDEMTISQQAAVPIGENISVLFATSVDRPFGIVQEHWRNNSRKNFTVAMAAILGTNLSRA